MFVGLIVLCIPAAARTCRHHSSLYHTVILPFGSRIRQGRADKSSTSKYSKRQLSSNNPYSDLRDVKTLKSPFPYARGPHTIIKSGNQHEFEEDGIHLTFEMQTTVHKKSSGDLDV